MTDNELVAMLDVKKIRAWVETQPVGSIVGDARDANASTVAAYILYTVDNVRRVYEYETTIVVSYADGTSETFPTPPEVKTFTSALEELVSCDSSQLTRERVLSLL